MANQIKKIKQGKQAKQTKQAKQAKQTKHVQQANQATLLRIANAMALEGAECRGHSECRQRLGHRVHVKNNVWYKTYGP